jgi:hypothetical protein
MCLDLLVVRKHVYNCNRPFIQSSWSHTCGCENNMRTCTVYSGESTWAAVIVAAYTVHKHIYLKRIWRMRQRGNWPWYFVILKSKSTVYLLTTFLKRLQILKHEWQEKPSWDQANRRQKLGLVWRIRKKISQIIKDYFYLPFFLLIILWLYCLPD